MADVKNRINDQILEVIFEVSRGIREEMAVDCQTQQLTVLQLQALVFIHKKKSLQMTEIADFFKISMPTATALLDRLVNFGWVERCENKKDRRMVNVSLTKKGESLLNKALAIIRQKVNKMLSYLSLEDRKQMLRILSNLNTNIGKAYEK